MNVSSVACAGVRPPCSGSNKTPVPTSWHSQGRAFFPVLLLALVAFPAFVSAVPLRFAPGVHIAIDGIHRRQDPTPPSNTDTNDSQGNDNGSISMNVWLPILIISVVFILFSLITCIRRCSASNAAAAAASTTTTDQSAPTPAGGNTTRPRRRPRRTPSQVSTKSLPPYMKEPGDQELVLFRGPSETEDDAAPPHAMPSLAEDEDEDEHPERRNGTFDVALDRVESVDTMADSSTTNLMRVPGPPELHRVATPHGRHRSGDAHSLDSVGSEAELLHGHQRGVSVDNHTDPRGEAPAYTEAASGEGGMSTISLNDPEPNVSSNVAPSLGRSRFSFLMHNPFGSRSDTSGTPSNANPPPSSMRFESPAVHMRSGSALSHFSTPESHESHHTRTPSRTSNLARSHSRSNSNLLRAFRSHSPGLHAGSSTISLDSISAPLTHTLTRAEFHAPKGGLLTPEQIKLITSREALERFGVPYGADAVAFSLSRERFAEMGPPPEFESVPGASGSGGIATGVTAPRSTSPSQPSLSDERAESRASSDMSYETAADLDPDWAQMVQRYASQESETADEPGTARPMTPRTARP